MKLQIVFILFSSLFLGSGQLKAEGQLTVGQVAWSVGGVILGLPGKMKSVYGNFKGAYEIAHCTKEELHKRMRVALLKQDSSEALYLLSIPEFDGTCFSPQGKAMILFFILMMGKDDIFEAFLRRKINLFESLDQFAQFPNPIMMLMLYSDLELLVHDDEVAKELKKDVIHVTFDSQKFEKMLYMLTDLGFDINQQFSEWRLTPAMLAAQPLYYMKGMNQLGYLTFDLSYKSLLDNQTKLEIILRHPSYNPDLTDKNGRTAIDLFNSQKSLYGMGERQQKFFEDFCM